MSYDSLPRYWMVPRRMFELHPQLEQLIWPQGLSPDEYIGEFYHVRHSHPNSTFLALLLADCQVRNINRADLTFPRWLKSRVGDLQ